MVTDRRPHAGRRPRPAIARRTPSRTASGCAPLRPRVAAAEHPHAAAGRPDAPGRAGRAHGRSDLLRRAVRPHAREPAAAGGPPDGRPDAAARVSCSMTIDRLASPAGGRPARGDRARRAARARARDTAVAETPPGDRVGDWRIRFRLGPVGTDYLARAAAACVGLEAGPAADELPAIAGHGRRRRPLSGRHRYRAALPSRRAAARARFWTLTTYDDRQATGRQPGRALLQRRLATASRSTPTARCRSTSSTARRRRRHVRTGCRRRPARSTSCSA